MIRITLKEKTNLSLIKIVILNYVRDYDKPDWENLKNYVLEAVLCDDGAIADAIDCLISDDYLAEPVENLFKLTSTGKLFFTDENFLSEEEYGNLEKVLSVWNPIVGPSAHKLKPIDTSPTKLLIRSAHAIDCLMTGKFGNIFGKAQTSDGIVKHIDPMSLDEILSTITACAELYALPNKHIYPKSLADLFCKYDTKFSWFLEVRSNGLPNKSEDYISTLGRIGIQPTTLKLAYTTLLDQTEQFKEVSKLEVQSRLVTLYRQWKELRLSLDDYYMWNKDYRTSLCRFNTFTMIYLSWMKSNISGERFPAFLQIKDGHKVFEQFRTFFTDEYKVRFTVLRRMKEDLLSKTKKYKEKIEC